MIDIEFVEVREEPVELLRSLQLGHLTHSWMVIQGLVSSELARSGGRWEWHRVSLMRGAVVVALTTRNDALSLVTIYSRSRSKLAEEIH